MRVYETVTTDREISIHALRVEGDKDKNPEAEDRVISIHALRVEGDGAARPHHSNHKYFYPRPPGGGRPTRVDKAGHKRRYFYPRPPGGGRLYSLVFVLIVVYFYPRPPGGGRLLFALFVYNDN